MLDQNTDRMWYVIGAVLIGAAIILIANGAFPGMFDNMTTGFASVTDIALNGVESISSGVSRDVKDPYSHVPVTLERPAEGYSKYFNYSEFDNGTLALGGLNLDVLQDQDKAMIFIDMMEMNSGYFLLPAEHEGVQVIEIHDMNDFDIPPNMALVIPNGIVHIGDAAFISSNISELYIPDSVKYIGHRAFEDNEFTEVELSQETKIDSVIYNGNVLYLPFDEGVTVTRR